MSEIKPGAKEVGAARSQPWLRRGIACTAGLAAVVVCLPSLLGLTPLRNSLLQWAAGSQHHITTRSASLGWFTSQQVAGLNMTNLESHGRILIERVHVDKSLSQLLLESPALGNLTIDQLNLDLVSAPPRSARAGGGQRRSQATFQAEIRDVNVIVREQPEKSPLVDLGGFNFMVQVRQELAGRRLTVEPTQLLNQQELTVEMCHRGLDLIAPVLANAANVDGNVSLRLDKLQVMLDQPNGFLSGADVDGHLVLHRVTAGLRNPLLTELAKALSKVLRIPMPSKVKLTDEADVHFWVRDGRVCHEGLAFGLPEVSPDLVIRTGGSVGMDRSLDMLVDVPLPLDQIHDGPLLQLLSERPLQFQVRGTMEQPVVSLPNNRQWYHEIADRLLANPNSTGDATGSAASTLDGVAPVAEALLDSVGSLLERRRQKSAERAPNNAAEKLDETSGAPAAGPTTPAPTPVLDRLRKLRSGRRGAAEPPPAAPPP